MTVAELGERMSAAEFGDWIAFYAVEETERRAAAAANRSETDAPRQ